MKTEPPHNSTPLDPDELAQLIPSDISTQIQLNEVEQKNIAHAQLWAMEGRHKDVLSQKFLLRLHREMFRWVWRWAGKFRHSEKNIGVPPHLIVTELQTLLLDTQYRIKNQTYDWDELGARFHHRLTLIHPFPNGNGRHARLMTDILLHQYGQETFSWGEKNWGKDLYLATKARKQYIAALHQADKHIYADLIKFMRM